MKDMLQGVVGNYWVRFAGRTIFYFLVIVALVYLYHYKNIDGGTFIYNEF